MLQKPKLPKSFFVLGVFTVLLNLALFLAAVWGVVHILKAYEIV